MPQPGHEAPATPFKLPEVPPGPAQGAPGCHFRTAADHGTWIKRQHPSEHYCVRPDLNAGLRYKVVDGDQWQCHDCQTVWTVRRTRSVARPWEFRRADSDNPPDYDG